MDKSLFMLFPMNPQDVAEILEEIGVLLEIQGENPFKTRAYSNAARAIEKLEEPLDVLIQEDRLRGVKGLGDSTREKVEELVRSGKLAFYEDLKSKTPPGIFELLEIPGLGPKKIKALKDQLQVDSVEKLQQACQSGEVEKLSGFGAKTQSKLIEGIELRKQFASRHSLSSAWSAALPILEALRSHPATIRCEIAGSLRRFKETIGDMDFLVSTNQPGEIAAFFAGLEQVNKVLVQGETKVSVLLDRGIQADLRLVSDAEFPFALNYFTGSKEHNVEMRRRAIKQGLRLNEYGLFRSQEETRDVTLLERCFTESEIYQKLGLAYVEPELREDRGEFEMAEKGFMPRLIEWTQIKGSLHNHSNWSDGRETLEEIARHMRDELGFSYWAITDHSQSSFQANGLSPDRLRKQIDTIRQLNEKLLSEEEGFQLLTGSEVDILPDGSLDFSDDLLSELDVVVASVHSSFTQPEKKMTQRILAAVNHPKVHIIGHLTGRLLLMRKAYEVDQKAIIDACAKKGVWIELNCNPRRFDMDWRLWKYAASKGVKCVINCDAHKNDQAAFLRLGAHQARKASLTADHVINTLPLNELKNALKKK
jgi:DNA polymerase (family X)